MTHSPSLQTLWQDRSVAGQGLVEPLFRYARRPDVIILAVPRGGIHLRHEEMLRAHSIDQGRYDAVVAAATQGSGGHPDR
jgi:hypothetical protein